MADWTRLGGGNSGIVGNAAHTYGFHCAADEIPASDYSRERDPNGADGPYAHWDYACAGDFAHRNDERLRAMHRALLARLMRGELPMICEFIGKPWSDRPVYYWARWNGVGTLQLYTGDGHDKWSHVSWYRSRANQRAYLWAPTSAPAPTPPSRSGDMPMGWADEDVIRVPAEAGWSTDNTAGAAKNVFHDMWLATLQARNEARALRAEMTVRDKAEQTRDAASAAAIKGLVDAIGKLTSGGGSVEAAPIIAAVRAVGDDTKSQFTELHKQLAAAAAEVDQLQIALARAAQAEADALATRPS